MVSVLLTLVLFYLAIGVIVGLLFVFKGVNRVDPVAADSPWVFRVVILPGSVGLWPVVLVKWLRGGEAGDA